jgi:hypothetical protein
MTTIRIYPSSLEQASTEVKDSCFVSALTQVLDKNNISYSFIEGNISYVTSDKNIIEASAQSNSYPLDIAVQLFDKQKLQGTLAPYGFNILPTEVITDVDSISLTNFIVKLKEGSGGNIVSYGKNWFGGVLFTDKEAFKRHPLFSDMFVSGKYVAQKAISNVRNHTAVSLSATVNSNGDVYFVRSSKDTWVNSNRTKAVLSYEGYDEQKAQIQSFVKSVGIKNAVLMLQFVEQDGILYPIDWNFRLGVNIPTQMINRNFVEYETAILHMVGDSQTPPASYTDTWVVEF